MTNTVTVTSRDDENTAASAQDSHTLVVSDAAPALAVDKSVPATIPEGQAATYTFTIRNTSLASDEPITVTSVIDNILGDLTGTSGRLDRSGQQRAHHSCSKPELHLQLYDSDRARRRHGS